MSAFSHLLRDVIYGTYLISEGGQDEDGNPIPPQWADPIRIRCRLEDKQTLVRHESGDEVVAKTRIVTETPITSDWRFWLPGANTNNLNESAEPLAVGSAATLDGRTRLYEAWFG